MNKKVTWGIVILFIGLFYTFQQYIPDNVLRYIFNYQVILMLLGLSFVLQKNSTTGWVIFGVGAYLYLKEFLGKYFNIGFPTVLIVGGISLVIFGIREQKLLKSRRDGAVYRSSARPNIKEDKIEDAEEIK